MRHLCCGWRALALALLLGCQLCTQAIAMIYRPSVGRFKDGFVLWHEGQFYLYSIYMPAAGDDSHFRNVWLATSRDGVHWKDVGAVVNYAPFNIWAMSVHQVGDRFIMNHGSFSRPCEVQTSNSELPKRPSAPITGENDTM